MYWCHFMAHPCLSATTCTSQHKFHVLDGIFVGKLLVLQLHVASIQLLHQLSSLTVYFVNLS